MEPDLYVAFHSGCRVRSTDIDLAARCAVGLDVDRRKVLSKACTTLGVFELHGKRFDDFGRSVVLDYFNHDFTLRCIAVGPLKGAGGRREVLVGRRA